MAKFFSNFGFISRIIWTVTLFQVFYCLAVFKSFVRWGWRNAFKMYQLITNKLVDGMNLRHYCCLGTVFIEATLSKRQWAGDICSELHVRHHGHRCICWNHLRVDIVIGVPRKWASFPIFFLVIQVKNLTMLYIWPTHLFSNLLFLGVLLLLLLLLRILVRIEVVLLARLHSGHNENAPYISGFTTLFVMPKKNIAAIKSSPNWKQWKPR